MPPGKYARPPITEAVIELRFASGISQSTMDKFVRGVRGEYPTAEPTYEISLQVGMPVAGNEAGTTSKQRFAGYRITGRDEANLIILMPDRLGTVRLAPYCGWEPFLERAKQDFSYLRKVTGYRNLARVAVRFINRIDIPRQDQISINTNDYISVEPRVPNIIPAIHSFATQFLGSVPSVEGQVLVNVATVASPLIDHVSLLLDIDLFKDQNLPQKDGDLWEFLAVLRTQKNALFEAFITDRARELFDRA